MYIDSKNGQDPENKKAPAFSHGHLFQNVKRFPSILHIILMLSAPHGHTEIGKS